MIQSTATNPFEGHVRVRACGILIENERILLLKHDGIGPGGHLWAPPGGGVSFGKTMEETLIEEFAEETNLKIEVNDYLFVNEYIGKKYHALEFFFRVTRISGDLRLGSDPELPENEQILSEVKFFSPKELNNLPADTIHNAFLAVNARDKIGDLRGFITFKH